MLAPSSVSSQILVGNPAFRDQSVFADSTLTLHRLNNKWADPFVACQGAYTAFTCLYLDRSLLVYAWGFFIQPSLRMDHIPLPAGCSFPQIQVPYLDNTPLDNGSWYTYPQRHGWQIERTKKKVHFWRNGEKCPVSEIAAFVQSWLYFALLREVTGETATGEQMSREGTEGRRFISTAGLETLLGAWTVHFSRSHDIPETKERLDNLCKLLIEHRSMCWSIYIYRGEVMDILIMLAIGVLAERLMAAVFDLYAHLGLEKPTVSPWAWRMEDIHDGGQLILSILRARGWCPYDVRTLDFETKQLSILYYYSNLKAPRSSKDHSECSGERCLAMSTNPSTYRLSHLREGCSCPLLFADQKEVAQILEQGSIPLISIVPDLEHKTLRISVKDLAQGHRFVAISHVWAEGSGNVKDNALHSCLLQNMSELVRRLPWERGSSDFTFWIDTLCVPVRRPELQTLALNKMRIPYERADHVLVLDSHLRSLESSTLSPTELFAQVSCSSWMRRLWTLQEGRLAKKVWFQFADTAIDVHSIHDVIYPNLDYSRVPSKIEDWMNKELYVLLRVVWNNYQTTIRHAYLALRSRSVSVPTDEALCLFNFMDKDLTQVTTVSPVQRMVVFWRSFERVSRSFVFSQASSKMSQKGLHWAPSSLLGFQSRWMGVPHEPYAIPTDIGLQVALPGFVFHQGIVKRMNEFGYKEGSSVFPDEDGAWYGMTIDKPWRQESGFSGTSHQLAVVLAHELRSAKPGSLSLGWERKSSSFPSPDYSDGVLVSVVRTEGEITYVTAHNHVKVQILGEGFRNYLSFASSLAKEVNTPHSTLSSESHVASKQRYKAAAERLLEDKANRDFLTGFARDREEQEDYEHLLDDMMDQAVLIARIGECVMAQKVPESRQWCID